MRGAGAGDAMKAGGSVLSGVAAYEAGKFNRKVAKVNAVNLEREGAAEAARVRDAARLTMGEQVAGQMAGGFQGGTGSAIDALKESAVNMAVGELMARRQARQAATASRVQGQIAYASGRNAFTGGMISAATALAGGG